MNQHLVAAKATVAADVRRRTGLKFAGIRLLTSAATASL